MFEVHHLCGAAGLGACLGAAIVHWLHLRRIEGEPKLIDKDDKLPVLDAARDVAGEVVDALAEALPPAPETLVHPEDPFLPKKPCGDKDCTEPGCPSAKRKGRKKKK